MSAEAWERDHGDGLFSKMSVAAPADGGCRSSSTARAARRCDRNWRLCERPRTPRRRRSCLASTSSSDTTRADSSPPPRNLRLRSTTSTSTRRARAPLASEASDGVPTDTRDQRTVSQRDRNTVDDVGVSSDEAFGSRTHAAGKREHVDVGGAIVMTPAFLVNGDVSVSSRDEAPGALLRGARRVRLARAHAGRPCARASPDALIVMLGEAARAWAPPRPTGASAADAVAVPTHAIALAPRGGRATRAPPSSRAWFGRMVLPDATSHPTFAGNHLRRVARGASRARSGRRGAGRSARRWRRFRVRRGGAWRTTRAAAPARCTAGWRAWRTPRAVAARTRVLKCVEPGTGAVWPDDLGAQSHCYDCAPTCVRGERRRRRRRRRRDFDRFRVDAVL